VAGAQAGIRRPVLAAALDSGGEAGAVQDKTAREAKLADLENASRQQQDRLAKLYESFNGKPMPDELNGGANLPKEQQ